MTHRIRKTGELISVISYNGDTRRDWMDRVSYIDSKGKEHDDEQLNYYWDLEEIEDKSENNIDWEQRRYELAKSAMNSILSNPKWDKVSELGFYKKNVVGNALSYADEMIKQLKNE